jgi:hypothetical protein
MYNKKQCCEIYEVVNVCIDEFCGMTSFSLVKTSRVTENISFHDLCTDDEISENKLTILYIDKTNRDDETFCFLGLDAV